VGPSSGCTVRLLSGYTLGVGKGAFLMGDEISSYIIICVFTGSLHIREYLTYRLHRLSSLSFEGGISQHLLLCCTITAGIYFYRVLSV
jgi:hypothetical protein